MKMNLHLLCGNATLAFLNPALHFYSASPALTKCETIRSLGDPVSARHWWGLKERRGREAGPGGASWGYGWHWPVRSIEAAPGSGCGSGGAHGERGRAAAGEGGGGAGPSLHVACTAHSEHRAHSTGQSAHSTEHGEHGSGEGRGSGWGRGRGCSRASPAAMLRSPGFNPHKRGCS